MTDYFPGFGNHVSTEAVSGALPVGRNSPQKPAFGLYAEQLSGTAFTAPRHENRRSWLYRLRPTADHRPFAAYWEAPLFAAPPGAASPHVDLVGIHVHIGSQVFVAEFFHQAVEVLAPFVGRFDLPEFVIGGGLGVMAGKAWRIGLMGHGATQRNVDIILAALRAVIA